MAQKSNTKTEELENAVNPYTSTMSESHCYDAI